MRHVRDIDLLVSPNNIPAAVALLQSAGYQVEPLPLGRKQSFKLTQATWWHIECRHSQTNLLVELHWRIEEVRSKSLEPRWQEWIHTTDSTLRDRYELLYLCLHGASHDWRRLKWLGDVHMLVTHLQEDDWLPLIDLAVYLRMEGLLAQTLLLLNWLFDFELPSAAKTLVTTQGRYATLLAKTALAEILNSEEAYELKMTAIWKNLKIPIQVSRRHRLHERVVYWLSIHCLRKGDLLAIPLPISLVWLYPLIRLPSILVRCLLSWKRHKLA